MKQTTLFLAIWMISLTGFAQDSVRVDQLELDRLRLLLQDNPKQDTTRVRHLSELAEMYFYNLDFVDGLTAANEARAISKALDFERGEGYYFRSMAIFHRNNDKMSLYYLIRSSWLLGRYSHFSPFLSTLIPVGKRDNEWDTINNRLLDALSQFKRVEEKETLAHIYFALSQQVSSEEKKQRGENRRIAFDLYTELNLSYPVLAIVTDSLSTHWRTGQEAKQLELNAANIYLEEHDKKLKALDAFLLGRSYASSNRFYLSLEYFFLAAEALNEINEKDLLRRVYWNTAYVYDNQLTNSEKGLQYEYKVLDLFEEAGITEGIEYVYLRIALSLSNFGRLDEVPEAYWAQIDSVKSGMNSWFDHVLLNLKVIRLQSENKEEESIKLLKNALEKDPKQNYRAKAGKEILLASIYKKNGNLTQALAYARDAHSILSKNDNYLRMLIDSSELLAEIYEELGQPTEALAYLKLNGEYKETLADQNNFAGLSDLEIQNVLKKTEKEIELLENQSLLKEQENKTQRLWIFSVSGALISFVFIAFILYRNTRQKGKANKTLKQALDRLKSTQAQLIQSEKMASLGELTAGIAHEIQNPLNFVNNFSEVSGELVDEMNEELEKGDIEEAKFIGKDLKDNLSKITLHGKRADAIVKGMLEHSKKGSGQKEPTDLNALADEFLRLSYQSFLAKEPEFKAELKTNLDPELPKVSVIPQDIGKVLLNLMNNAFYACAERLAQSEVEGSRSTVNEKAKSTPQPPEGGEKYTPTISVSSLVTKSPSGDLGVEISVQDNGSGIPESIKEKIFQPFFTTKPTGSGTGLGLSLSYDIVKAHGGELRVQSDESNGTKFILTLNT